MAEEAWQATGVIEAPPDRVLDTLLAVREGPIGPNNAPLLRALPWAGPLLGNATLRGGPNKFTLHYGAHPGSDAHPGGTVEVDRPRGYFSFHGGYKFAAEYHFTPHPKGTLLTYKAFNVAPESHRTRPAVCLQFWLGAKLNLGLRSSLRHTAKTLACRAYPGN